MTATSQDIGPDLVAGARRGDPEALNTLVTRAYPVVRRWALVHTGDPAEADDLTQGVLVQVIRHLDAYQGDSRFTTWLYAVTRHAAADRFRDAIGAGASRAIRVRRPSWHHAPVLRPRRSSGRVASDPWCRPSSRSCQRANARSSTWRICKASAPREIAERLGIEAGSVRAHLFKARRTLRARILAEHPHLLEEAP